MTTLIAAVVAIPALAALGAWAIVAATYWHEQRRHFRTPHSALRQTRPLESVDRRAHVLGTVRRRELHPNAIGTARHDRKRNGHNVYAERSHPPRERDRVAGEHRHDRVFTRQHREAGHQLAEQGGIGGQPSTRVLG